MIRSISRRALMQGAAASAILAGFVRPAYAAGRPVRIGVVAPLTGPLALFTEHLDFVIGQVQAQYGGEITINGTVHPLEIIIKDSQSNPNRASEVASELILAHEVDIMTSFGTPETSNPVSDQCDLNGIPSVSTDTPLESWFFGRGGDPSTGFEWSFNFFLNVPDLVNTYLGIWNRVPGNQRKIGLLLANDNDGNAFAGLMPAPLQAEGYSIVDPGRFDLPASNYNAQISAFKKERVDGVIMSLPSPEIAAFWNESAQQGFQPLFMTPGKGGEFPPGIYPFEDRALNLSVEVWWDRTFPYSSSLNGGSSADLADAYEKFSGQQASMALGYTHALFEVALGALKNAANIEDRGTVRDALRDTSHQTVVGPIEFTKGPLPNCWNTPLVGGQWRKGAKWPLELVIVDNTVSPEIPVGGDVEAITYS
ncbi:MAG: ABC transporter substrate-binding protein [Devosia sp.]|nr:ABC transporter substrate-binding protein [Devosia sp.]